MRHVLAVLLVATAMAGCTAHVSGASHAEYVPAKVHHVKADVPKDRDERAVLAALRPIDACALTGVNVRVRGIGRFTAKSSWQRGPHNCRLISEDLTSQIKVTIGVDIERVERFLMRPATIAGAKAYFRSGGESCTAAIPVSFRYAVTIRILEEDPRHPCADLSDPTRTVIRNLDRPPSVDQPDVWSEWDACSVLRLAMRQPGNGRNLQTDDQLGMARCVAPDYSVILRYSDPLGQRSLSIAGRTVHIDEGERCILNWRAGAGRGGHAADIELSAPDCDSGKTVARKAIEALSRPFPGQVPRQHPLTYRPDEPDVAAAGACADVPESPALRDCQPYQAVSVPHGGDRLILAANDDRNVLCALAADAVRTHIEPTLKSATIKQTDLHQDRCVFVEPTHAIQLWIWMDDAPISPDTTIAGRGATINADSNTYRTIAIQLTDRPEAGTLNVELALLPPRDADRSEPVDNGQLDKVTDVVAQIARTYL